jgi:polyisoprenoid-binding protein YceI
VAAGEPPASRLAEVGPEPTRTGPPAEVGSAETPARAPASLPARTRRSFLSFALPGDGFAFDQLQRFEIIPSLSRVGFDAKSTLHDFTGVTSAVRGSVVARLSAPGQDAAARIEADAAALDTGLADRNAAMREHLASDAHPKIVFELRDFEPAAVDSAARQVSGTVAGSMTVRGVTRPLSMPVRLSVDDRMRLVVEGESPLLLSDFRVPVPSQLGIIGMQDEVRIWISLRARFAGRVKP